MEDKTPQIDRGVGCWQMPLGTPSHQMERKSSWIPCSLNNGFSKMSMGFPAVSDGKEPACNVGDAGSVPGLGRSPREGIGYPFQYSCLENPMDGGAWWPAVHGVAKSRTQLKN